MKRGIYILAGTALILLAGAGAHGLWLRTALRYRPWQLEAFLDTRIGECAHSPGAASYRPELERLEAAAALARSCLSGQDGRWLIRRDYGPCQERLLHLASETFQLRMLQRGRLLDESRRLEIFLAGLEAELAGAAREKSSGMRFEVRNSPQAAARILAAQARVLQAQGQTGSAVETVLRAWGAWKRSESLRTTELARFYDAQSRRLWQTQAVRLLQWTKRTGRPAILVSKLEHRCLLLMDGRVARVFAANLGRNWHRRKQQERDASTPEGAYTVKRKFRSPAFGWALLLDYPNADDRRRFEALKRSGALHRRARIGGNIEIHGRGRAQSDWTDGCVSLKDEDMKDIYGYGYPGMPVSIVGSCSLALQSKD